MCSHSSVNSQRKKATIFDLFLCWFVYCVSHYGGLDAHAALWTNQMGYIIVIARLPGIYGNVNRPCPRATPSDSGRFTAINPRRLGVNYYIYPTSPLYPRYQAWFNCDIHQEISLIFPLSCKFKFCLHTMATTVFYINLIG